MDFLPVFEAIEALPLGVAIRDSIYLFPLIQVIHLSGMALMIGSIMAANIRLMHVRADGAIAAQTTGVLRPAMWIGFWITILSGLALFTGEAVKCYYHPAFAWKMALLLGAVIFELSLRRGRQTWSAASVRIGAITSLTLWLGVAVAGRLIGFL